MLWLFSSDIFLHVLSFLEFKDVLALHLLSRDIRQYLADHEVAIFHQLAILHRFVSAGVALEDAVRAEEPHGDWLKGVQNWKELCQRWVTLGSNWSGRGRVIEGGYVNFDDPVRAFKVDETDRTILAVADRLNKYTLVVCDMQSGQSLWSLDGLYFGGLAYSNGLLVIMRSSTGIEIWRRAAGVHRTQTSSGSYTSCEAHHEPSPLALSREQERWLQQDTTSNVRRGRYVPHGYLPSFDGMPFRFFSFRFPVLAVVDGADDRVIQLYDVVRGSLMRKVNLVKLAQACSEPGYPFQPQSVLLDIDISDELLCATFDGDILITPIHAADDTSASTVSSTILFGEYSIPYHFKDKAMHLVRSAAADDDTPSDNAVIDASVLKIACNARGAMEVYKAVLPSAIDEEESMALVRPWHRSTAFFMLGKFSPNGRHVIAGSGYGLLYLLPNVHDMISGLTKTRDTVEKLNVREPLRDIVWQGQDHHILVRTEPGDTFLININPKYHKDISLVSEAIVRFDTTLVHRLPDFCNIYGTNFGNVQVTRTSLWLMWDAVSLHESMCERMKVAENERRVSRPAKDKAITVCFMDFSPVV